LTTLGRWLQEHNPSVHVDWKNRTLTFNSTDCLSRGCPYTVYAKGSHQRDLSQNEKNSVEIKMVKASHFSNLQRKGCQGFLFTPREQEKNFCSATLHNVADSDYDRFMIGK